MTTAPPVSAHRTCAPEGLDADLHLQHILTDAFTKEDAARTLVALEDAPPPGADMRAVRRALAAVPVLTLYVPRALGTKEVKKIATWSRKEVGECLLLEIVLDPASAGGCRFVWGGIWHDYSLSHFMRTHEAEYARVIDRVLGAAPA